MRENNYDKPIPKRFKHRKHNSCCTDDENRKLARCSRKKQKERLFLDEQDAEIDEFLEIFR